MLHTFHGIRYMMLRCLIISGVHFYHSVKVVLVKFLHHEIIIFLNKYLMGIYFKIMKYLVFLHCCTLTLTSIDDSYHQLLLLCCLSDGDFSIFLFIFNNWNYKEELRFLPPPAPISFFFLDISVSMDHGYLFYTVLQIPLLSLFILFLKLSHVGQLRFSSDCLLCSFISYYKFFEHFLFFWHEEIFQAHLVLSVP